MLYGLIKNRKAPGVCGITKKMPREVEVVGQWMHKIISQAWRSGSVPTD